MYAKTLLHMEPIFCAALFYAIKPTIEKIISIISLQSTSRIACIRKPYINRC